jgi:TolB-like protein
VLSLLLVLGCARLALAAGDGKDRAAAPGGEADRDSARLTVAVLDFAANDPAAPKLGSDVAAALTAMLSGEPGITLVERQSLAQTLREHELNMTGLVNDEKAVKIGKLAGAKIMITGRAFRLGNDLFITAKLVGTETGLIEGVMVKDASSADMGTMVVSLAEKVARKVRQVGPKLVAGPEDAFDPVPALKKKLADRHKPIVAVVVREQHHAAPLPAAVGVRPIDPAVETEVKRLLTECGFTVQDVPENELTDFARGWAAKDVNSWPRGLDKVEVLAGGEAFSEFAVRIGSIVSCSARAEINLVSRKDGKIVLADRSTTRAADLSENIAGKKALQGAGRTLGIRILQHFAETLPAEKPPPKDKTP